MPRAPPIHARDRVNSRGIHAWFFTVLYLHGGHRLIAWDVYQARGENQMNSILRTLFSSVAVVATLVGIPAVASASVGPEGDHAVVERSEGGDHDGAAIGERGRGGERGGQRGRGEHFEHGRGGRFEHGRGERFEHGRRWGYDRFGRRYSY
jgi:hypothetical protein